MNHGTNHQDTKHIHQLFEKIWADYVAFNPKAKRVYDLILAHEKQTDPSVTEIKNDHVAYRTYDVSPIGVDAIGAIFEKHGYKKCDRYIFNDKKLIAYHWEHQDASLPKVFISELETKKLSPFVQKIAQEAAQAVNASDVKKMSSCGRAALGKPTTRLTKSSSKNPSTRRGCTHSVSDPITSRFRSTR